MSNKTTPSYETILERIDTILKQPLPDKIREKTETLREQVAEIIKRDSENRTLLAVGLDILEDIL